MDNRHKPLTLLYLEESIKRGVTEYQAEHQAPLDIDALTQHALAALVLDYGGVQLYIPMSTTLEAQRRAEKIYQEFNGHNHKALAKKYNLSETRIYQIIQEQRELLRNRQQTSLF